MPIDFRAYYIHPAHRSTGSFLVHPDDAPVLQAWRNAIGHRTMDHTAIHPPTGARLLAFEPVEGDWLQYVEQQQGIQDGDLCRVWYEDQMRGQQVQMKFRDARRI